MSESEKLGWVSFIIFVLVIFFSKDDDWRSTSNVTSEIILTEINSKLDKIIGKDNA
ncbi:MAG: hypothetical protein NC124_02240 [Clostridium sp.]|nr:hypothetical protein [Clostridium sp.]